MYHRVCFSHSQTDLKRKSSRGLSKTILLSSRGQGLWADHCVPPPMRDIHVDWFTQPSHVLLCCLTHLHLRAGNAHISCSQPSLQSRCLLLTGF